MLTLIGLLYSEKTTLLLFAASFFMLWVGAGFYTVIPLLFLLVNMGCVLSRRIGEGLEREEVIERQKLALEQASMRNTFHQVLGFEYPIGESTKLIAWYADNRSVANYKSVELDDVPPVFVLGIRYYIRFPNLVLDFSRNVVPGPPHLVAATPEIETKRV